MPLSFALLLAAPPVEVYREQVRLTLRQEGLPLALAVLIQAAGLGAMGLYALRARRRDPALLWFGLFAWLYGLRLMLDAETFRFASGWSGDQWLCGSALITYLIPLPALLFGGLVLDAQRRMRWVVGMQAAFALAGIASDLLRQRPYSLATLNNAWVLVFMLSFALLLWRDPTARQAARPLRWGLLSFVGAAVINNLWELAEWPSRINPEPLGFLLLLAGLGQVLARRVWRNEERLTALDQELDVARRIQRSILPKDLPPHPQLQVAARYIPMAAVAGDFYDFLVLDPQRIGLLVADVSGHGVPAALIASMVKVAIAAQQAHADDPARVLAGVNEILCGKLKGQFVTAGYLYVDLAQLLLRYASAGHPPLLWWRAASQQVQTVSENGMMLSASRRARYRAAEHALRPGDRLVLYTDGLLEAMDAAGEQFTQERFDALVPSTAHQSADEAATAIVDAVSRWAGYPARPPQDDLTLLVVDIMRDAPPPPAP